MMFGYVSVAQLSADIRAKLHAVPRDIDLVVGIPRSGMIPAYLIGLYLNRLVVDLETFLANGVAGHGDTRKVAMDIAAPQAARHVLLVDDSLQSGGSLQRSIERIRASPFSGKLTTCVAIVAPVAGSSVDLFFREMPQPRIFEWNAFHHDKVERSCFDLDGILCVDPTREECDDGPRYQQFLRTARPLFKPTQKIGHIVSARLEKHRAPTEEWLAANGISYGALHLIDLPSEAERRRLRAHSVHKAKVYRETDSVLFYESELEQAKDIARLSGRPVLCTADMTLQLPTGLQLTGSWKQAKWRLKTPVGRIKGWLRQRMRAR
jgi:uncharacterized HAD superfamily protein